MGKKRYLSHSTTTGGRQPSTLWSQKSVWILLGPALLALSAHQVLEGAGKTAFGLLGVTKTPVQRRGSGSNSGGLKDRCNCVDEPIGLEALRIENDSHVRDPSAFFHTIQCFLAHHQQTAVRRNISGMQLSAKVKNAIVESERSPASVYESEADKIIHGTRLIMEEYEQKFGTHPFVIEGLPSGEWEGCFRRRLELLERAAGVFSHEAAGMTSLLALPVKESQITELPDVRMFKRIGKLVQLLMDPMVAAQNDGNLNVQIPSVYISELNKDSGVRMQLYLRCRTAAAVICNSFTSKLGEAFDPQVRGRAGNAELQATCEAQTFAWIVRHGQTAGTEWEPDLGRSYFSLAAIFAGVYQAMFFQEPAVLGVQLANLYGEGHKAAAQQCAQYEAALRRSPIPDDNRIATDPRLLPACSAALRATHFTLTLTSPFPGMLYPRSEDGAREVLRKLFRQMFGHTPFGPAPDAPCLSPAQHKQLDDLVREVLHALSTSG